MIIKTKNNRGICIDMIKSYNDVNTFLKNYKKYFKFMGPSFLITGYGWIFEFNKIISSRTITIDIVRHLSFSERNRYTINDNPEPNIRAFIWNNKEWINKEIIKREEAETISLKKLYTDKILEEKIKNTK